MNSATREAVERDIPRDRVISLRDVLSGDPDSEEDFVLIEDLATVIVFSRVEKKRVLANRVLSKMLSTPVQVYRMTADSEVFVYLTFNGIEDGFFHVGTYPDGQPTLEEYPTQSQVDSLERYCAE